MKVFIVVFLTIIVWKHEGKTFLLEVNQSPFLCSFYDSEPISLNMYVAYFSVFPLDTFHRYRITGP